MKELVMCDSCHEFPATIKCLVCQTDLCDQCSDEHDKTAVYDEAHTGHM